MSLTANDIGVLANFLTPRGNEQIDISGGAIHTLANIPDLPEDVDILAIIQCQDGEVRYLDDGTDPTATIGFVLFNPIPLEYQVRNLKDVALKFIQPAAVADYIVPGTIINVLYYTYAESSEI